MLGVMIAIFIGLGVWFAVWGRSGYMEMVPVALTQIAVFVTTFTPLIKPPKNTEQSL